MKFITTLLLMSAVMYLQSGLQACKSDTSTNESTTTEAHDAHDHVHDYACPMHPEMQGHEGEKCNTCGMPLEPMDKAGAKQYTMAFQAMTPPVQAGKSVTLSFTPKQKDKMDALVPLDVSHEKKIHLIVVNEGLTWFDHIHPEFQADGSYTVEETFPGGGNYLLFADYKPSGSSHQLEKIELEVSGDPIAPQAFNSSGEKATSGDYSIILVPDEKAYYAGKEIHFDGVVTRKGKAFDINDFQTYLGAKGHMVGIEKQTKTYVHMHPEVENGKFHFHTTFPEPGSYRVWLQFMNQNKLHTIDYTLQVEAGNAKDPGEHSAEDNHEEHKH